MTTGVCDQQLREQLLSLLGDYPKEWLKIWRQAVVVNKAIDHASAWFSNNFYVLSQ
jgi:hypothetical protein